MLHYAPTLSAGGSILVLQGGGNGINDLVVIRNATQALPWDIKTVPDLVACVSQDHVPGSRFQVPGSRFQVPGSRFEIGVQYSKLIWVLSW